MNENNNNQHELDADILGDNIGFFSSSADVPDEIHAYFNESLLNNENIILVAVGKAAEGRRERQRKGTIIYLIISVIVTIITFIKFFMLGFFMIPSVLFGIYYLTTTGVSRPDVYLALTNKRLLVKQQKLTTAFLYSEIGKACLYPVEKKGSSDIYIRELKPAYWSQYIRTIEKVGLGEFSTEEADSIVRVINTYCRNSSQAVK
ncbi:MAG: hypothetical protein IJ368_04060 [Oscillospiraceae bacterium]|nr:hypothetical protein [Oscillospiraceae bacterium]